MASRCSPSSGSRAEISVSLSSSALTPAGSRAPRAAMGAVATASGGDSIQSQALSSTPETVMQGDLSRVARRPEVIGDLRVGSSACVGGDEPLACSPAVEPVLRPGGGGSSRTILRRRPLTEATVGELAGGTSADALLRIGSGRAATRPDEPASRHHCSARDDTGTDPQDERMGLLTLVVAGSSPAVGTAPDPLSEGHSPRVHLSPGRRRRRRRG
jgi:hypothetical protein